jgi:hypothetical protein
MKLPPPAPLSPLQRYQSTTDTALSTEVLDLLIDADPIGLIAQGAPRDEYLPEARTIAARSTTARTCAELLTIIHDEFIYWFGDQAGLTEHYRLLAATLWQRIQAR